MSGRYRNDDYYGRSGDRPPPQRNYDRRGPPPPRYNNNDYRGGGGPRYYPPDNYRRNSGPRHSQHRPRGGGGGGNRSSGHPKHQIITFSSYEEERQWVENRRRQRKSRPSKFDVMNGSGGVTVASAGGIGGASEPQQTRHARRLYVGNLPPAVTEAQIHEAFTQAIRKTMPKDADTTTTPLLDVHKEDPILTVYINYER